MYNPALVTLVGASFLANLSVVDAPGIKWVGYSPGKKGQEVTPPFDLPVFHLREPYPRRYLAARHGKMKASRFNGPAWCCLFRSETELHDYRVERTFSFQEDRDLFNRRRTSLALKIIRWNNSIVIFWFKDGENNWDSRLLDLMMQYLLCASSLV